MPSPKISVLELSRDFSTWCTLVCLRNIVLGTHKVAVFWTIVFIIMVIAFCILTVGFVTKYFSYPTSIDNSLASNVQPFPRVSVCNQNPYKLSKVQTMASFSEVNKLVVQYQAIEQGLETDDDFNLKEATTKTNRMERAQIMLRLLTNDISDDDRYAAGYDFVELVTECTMGGITCSSLNFESFLHPDYGVCYTFVSKQNVSQTGHFYGLRMMMTVYQNSPGAAFDFLPTTDSAALQVVVHDANVSPDFATGFRVGCSFQAFVALSREEEVYMSSPYGSCVNSMPGDDDYYDGTNLTYTISDCYYACLQTMSQEICGCVDTLYPKAANQTYCTTGEDAACLSKVMTTKSDPWTPAGKNMCNCPPACFTGTFNKVITYASFPALMASGYQVATGTEAQRDVLLSDMGGGRTGDSASYNDITTEAPVPAFTTIPDDFTLASVDYSTETSPNVATVGTSSPAAVTTGATTTTADAKTTQATTTGPSSTSTTTTSTTTTTSVTIRCGLGSTHTPASAMKCMADPTLAAIYDSPQVSVIYNTDYCTSSKICNTCIIYSSDSTNAWPCYYPAGSQGTCTEWSDPTKSLFNISCAVFMTYFDFIPYGTQMPELSGNAAEMNTTTTDMFTSATECTSSTIQTLNSSIQKSTSFMSVSSVYSAPGYSSDLTGCELADVLEYGSVLSADEGVGKRRKREVLTTNVTDEDSDAVANDIPGVGSCEYANTNFDTASACIQWYQQNGLIVQIYFNTLTTNTYTQSSSYPMVSLISDVSGMAGLWLGMSVVTVIEILGLLLMCIKYALCGRKIDLSTWKINKPVDSYSDDSDGERENDSDEEQEEPSRKKSQ